VKAPTPADDKASAAATIEGDVSAKVGLVRCVRCGLDFHPAYTESLCPLCGEPAAAVAEPVALSFWMGLARWATTESRAQWVGVALFVLSSLVLLIYAIAAYYRQ